MPKTLRTYSRDVNYGSDTYNYRKSLEKEKKKEKGTNGLTINEKEAIMASDSLPGIECVNKTNESLQQGS